jgi:hypothetical protein
VRGYLRVVCALLTIGAISTLVAGSDPIVLSMRRGPGVGEVSLCWQGAEGWSDVHRSLSPVEVASPANRIGSTPASVWADRPGSATLWCYIVREAPANTVEAAALEPAILLLHDSSASMGANATGFGPPGCAGGLNTRLDHAKCGLFETVASQGEPIYGLARFRTDTADTFCGDGCVLSATSCQGCVPASGNGCTPAMTGDSRVELLASLRPAQAADVLRWVDYACETCGHDTIVSPEIFAVGFGPIAGSLRGLRRYLQGLQASDTTTLWPESQPGFDPIRNDPLREVFVGGQQCRPYLIALIVDGDEACTTFGQTLEATSALLATDVDGRTYRIETKPLGFGKTPGDAEIEALAHAGGATDVPGALEGFYPRSADEVEADLSRILASSVRFERCNEIDDDCDGLVDESFPAKGRPCTAGGIGACAGTGVEACSADGDGTVCQVEQPGGDPAEETCNGLDDDCDGAVDEGCGSCVPTERCGNGVDDDCDARIDEGCDACVEWADPSGGLEIMRYEASRPDATPYDAGTDESAPCSRAGVQPWTQVTPAEAAQACASIGARLCTEQEWERACAVRSMPVYPLSVPAAGGVFVEAEDFAAITPALGADGTWRAWMPATIAGFSGGSALRAMPDTGANVTGAVDALGQSPRLDFQFAATVTGFHYVWVRMYSATGSANDLWLGVSDDPATSPPTQQLATTSNGSWSWVRSAPINVLSTAPRFLSLYMREDGLLVDVIHLTRNSSTTPPAFSPAPNGGDWAYATNPDVYQAAVCNDEDLDTDPAASGDDDHVLAAGSVPGGACFANGPSTEDVHDLSGNVKEWTAARMPNGNPLRGGASNVGAHGTRCDAVLVAGDEHFAPNVGFRCCR